jgi:hypothetical protein
MFAKTIIDSDAFIDMPLSTQALYFHLSMRADDDGFINNPKKIQRMIGASDDDLKVLIMKRFLLPFDSGVVVIKHWKIHNYIRNDRYKETVYQDEKARLTVKENGAYTEAEKLGIPSVNQPVYQMDTQVRLGKERLGQDSLEVVECSVVTDNDDTNTSVENSVENSRLKLLGGKLGKGVVFLSDDQIEKLLDTLGLEAFDRYVERLADFIIDKKAHVKSHYDTILKWYREDSKV